MVLNLPDLINGAFELCGGLALCANIRQLVRDKQVKGIHWGSTIFFTSWGLWNVYYYPHLEQWASFAGGLFIAAANVVWLVLRVHYSHFYMPPPPASPKWSTPPVAVGQLLP